MLTTKELADEIFSRWFDGLISKDEAIADAILKGVGKELNNLIKFWESQHK